MKTMSRLLMLAGMFALIEPAFVHSANAQDGKTIEQKSDRLEQKIDSKVKKHKITQQQGDQLKSEAEGVKTEAQADRKSGNGKLTKAQRKELHGKLKQTRKELHQDVKASPSPAAQ